MAAPQRQPVTYCPCGCTTFGPALACPKCGKRPLDWPDGAHKPDIENEVLTVVWSTVRATGETTLRVVLGNKVGSWTAPANGTYYEPNNGGTTRMWACSKEEAVCEAVRILGGEWK